MQQVRVTISNHAWVCIGYVLTHCPDYTEIKGFYEAKEIYKKYSLKHSSVYQNNIDEWMGFMSLVEVRYIEKNQASLLWELLRESETFEGVKPRKQDKQEVIQLTLL